MLIPPVEPGVVIVPDDIAPGDVEPGIVDPGVIVPDVPIDPGDIVSSCMEPDDIVDPVDVVEPDMVPVEPGIVALRRVRVRVPRRVRVVVLFVRIEDEPGDALCIWLPEDVDMFEPLVCAIAAAGTISAAAAIMVIIRIVLLLGLQGHETSVTWLCSHRQPIWPRWSSA